MAQSCFFVVDVRPLCAATQAHGRFHEPTAHALALAVDRIAHSVLDPGGAMLWGFCLYCSGSHTPKQLAAAMKEAPSLSTERGSRNVRPESQPIQPSPSSLLSSPSSSSGGMRRLDFLDTSAVERRGNAVTESLSAALRYVGNRLPRILSNGVRSAPVPAGTASEVLHDATPAALARARAAYHVCVADCADDAARALDEGLAAAPVAAPSHAHDMHEVREAQGGACGTGAGAGQRSPLQHVAIVLSPVLTGAVTGANIDLEGTATLQMGTMARKKDAAADADEEAQPHKTAESGAGDCAGSAGDAGNGFGEKEHGNDWRSVIGQWADSGDVDVQTARWGDIWRHMKACGWRYVKAPKHLQLVATWLFLPPAPVAVDVQGIHVQYSLDGQDRLWFADEDAVRAYLVKVTPECKTARAAKRQAMREAQEREHAAATEAELLEEHALNRIERSFARFETQFRAQNRALYIVNTATLVDTCANRIAANVAAKVHTTVLHTASKCATVHSALLRAVQALGAWCQVSTHLPAAMATEVALCDSEDKECAGGIVELEQVLLGAELLPTVAAADLLHVPRAKHLAPAQRSVSVSGEQGRASQSSCTAPTAVQTTTCRTVTLSMHAQGGQLMRMCDAEILEPPGDGQPFAPNAHLVLRGFVPATVAAALHTAERGSNFKHAGPRLLRPRSLQCASGTRNANALPLLLTHLAQQRQGAIMDQVYGAYASGIDPNVREHAAAGAYQPCGPRVVQDRMWHSFVLLPVSDSAGVLTRLEAGALASHSRFVAPTNTVAKVLSDQANQSKYSLESTCNDTITFHPKLLAIVQQGQCPAARHRPQISSQLQTTSATLQRRQRMRSALDTYSAQVDATAKVGISALRSQLDQLARKLEVADATATAAACVAAASAASVAASAAAVAAHAADVAATAAESVLSPASSATVHRTSNACVERSFEAKYVGLRASQLRAAYNAAVDAHAGRGREVTALVFALLPSALRADVGAAVIADADVEAGAEASLGVSCSDNSRAINTEVASEDAGVMRHAVLALLLPASAMRALYLRAETDGSANNSAVGGGLVGLADRVGVMRLHNNDKRKDKQRDKRGRKRKKNRKSLGTPDSGIDIVGAASAAAAAVAVEVGMGGELSGAEQARVRRAALARRKQREALLQVLLRLQLSTCSTTHGGMSTNGIAGIVETCEHLEQIAVDLDIGGGEAISAFLDSCAGASSDGEESMRGLERVLRALTTRFIAVVPHVLLEIFSRMELEPPPELAAHRATPIVPVDISPTARPDHAQQPRGDARRPRTKQPQQQAQQPEKKPHQRQHSTSTEQPEPPPHQLQQQRVASHRSQLPRGGLGVRGAVAMQVTYARPSIASAQAAAKAKERAKRKAEAEVEAKKRAKRARKKAKRRARDRALAAIAGRDGLAGDSNAGNCLGGGSIAGGIMRRSPAKSHPAGMLQPPTAHRNLFGSRVPSSNSMLPLGLRSPIVRPPLAARTAVSLQQQQRRQDYTLEPAVVPPTPVRAGTDALCSPGASAGTGAGVGEVGLPLVPPTPEMPLAAMRSTVMPPTPEPTMGSTSAGGLVIPPTPEQMVGNSWVSPVRNRRSDDIIVQETPAH